MSQSLKASRFIKANRSSPVVYGSIDDHVITYRLEDGSAWSFSRREGREIGHPRWAHMEVERRRALVRNRVEERKLLKKLEAEAAQPERHPER